MHAKRTLATIIGTIDFNQQGTPREKFSMRAVILCLVSALLLTFSQAQAFAATLLVTPGRFDADDTEINIGDRVFASLLSGRSYECSVTQKLITDSNSFITFDLQALDPSGSPINLTPSGNVHPAIAAPVGKSSLRSRVTLIAQETGNYSLGFDLAVSAFGTVRCRESTLLGDFNSFFASTQILELSNTANVEIDAQVQVIDFSGNILFEEEVSIEAGRRVDTVLSDIPSETYGSIRVTSLAPVGALRGTVSEYDFGDSIILKRERELSRAVTSN